MNFSVFLTYSKLLILILSALLKYHEYRKHLRSFLLLTLLCRVCFHYRYSPTRKISPHILWFCIYIAVSHVLLYRFLIYLSRCIQGILLESVSWRTQPFLPTVYHTSHLRDKTQKRKCLFCRPSFLRYRLFRQDASR